MFVPCVEIKNKHKHLHFKEQCPIYRAGRTKERNQKTKHQQKENNEEKKSRVKGLLNWELTLDNFYSYFRYPVRYYIYFYIK